MQFNDILIKPYHTEKSYRLRKGQNPSCLTFVINKKANKHQVKLAFKAIYNVVPEKINIVNRKPSLTRTGTLVPGYTKLVKLAYVTLPKDMQIAITKDEMEEAVKTQNESKTSTKPQVDTKVISASKIETTETTETKKVAKTPKAKIAKSKE